MTAVDGSFAQPTPDQQPEIALDRNVSARGALIVIERSCIEYLKANEAALQQTRAPEALHQMRVALRRWRTALAVLGEVATPEDKAAGGELKWMAGELDEARDLDVFAESRAVQKSKDPPQATGTAAFGRALAQARTRAYKRAAEAIASERWRRFLWDAGKRASAPAWIDDEGPSARRLATAALARRAKRVKSGGRRLRKLEPEARHRLRIEAKKARYTAELFGDLFGQPRRRRRFVEVLRKLQGALGDLNDIHVGRGLAERFSKGGERTVVAGADDAKRSAQLLRKAAKAHDQFLDLKRFW